MSSSGLDEAMEKIGSFGRYQKLLIFALGLVFLPLGFFLFAAVFLYDTPRHRCFIPSIDQNETFTSDMNKSILHEYIPEPRSEMDGEEFSQCSRYALDDDWKNFTGENSTNIVYQSCLEGWLYDGERTSAVNEFDLVCENAWKKPLLTSALMIGCLIGSVCSGPLTDRYGRRTISLSSLYLGSVSILLMSFVSRYEILVLAIIISAILHINQYCSNFVLAQELVDKSHRALAACVINVMFAAGYMMLPLVAYFIRDWRWLLRFLSAFHMLYIPYFWFLPESPRWLISKGKKEEAFELLTQIAQINGTDGEILDGLKSNNFNLLSQPQEKPSDAKKRRRSSSVHILATNSVMRNRSFILFSVWNVSFLCYYVFGYNTSNLGGNNYVNCFIAAALEIPCSFFVAFSIQKCGRRNSLSYFFLLAGLCCIIVPLLSSVESASIAFAMIGKFFATSSMAELYLYTSELYPTLLRNTGVSLSSMSSRFSTIFSPFIVFAGEQVSKNIPFYIMAALGFTTTAISLLLPETKHSPLPDTMHDALKLEDHRITISSCRSKSMNRKDSQVPLKSKSSISDGALDEESL